MSVSISFNPEKHCLGDLCSRKHEYQNTGKSLRYKSHKSCVICNSLQRKEWERKNPEKAKRNKRENDLKNDYGISIDEYSKMLAIQGGVCAICKRPPKGNRLLCIDHNHDNGEIRGLLCDGCNRGIGFLEEDIDRLKSAIVYLNRMNK